MILNQNESIILIIDIQEKLLKSVFNRDLVERKSKMLVEAAKILDVPIFVTEQYPQGLGETIVGLKDKAFVYEKTSFNALEDVNLLQQLQKCAKKQIVVFGIETHICVHQTVASLISAGFDVTLVKDACGSRSEIEYDAGIFCMKENGVKIKTVEMVLFEWLKSSKHPNFREIQNLIKN